MRGFAGPLAVVSVADAFVVADDAATGFLIVVFAAAIGGFDVTGAGAGIIGRRGFVDKLVPVVGIPTFFVGFNVVIVTIAFKSLNDTLRRSFGRTTLPALNSGDACRFRPFPPPSAFRTFSKFCVKTVRLVKCGGKCVGTVSSLCPFCNGTDDAGAVDANRSLGTHVRGIGFFNDDGFGNFDSIFMCRKHSIVVSTKFDC